MKADNMSFEQTYLDGSGIEFAVRMKVRRFHGERGGERLVEFEHCGTVDFPVDQLDWLIGCLERIKAEVSDGR